MHVASLIASPDKVLGLRSFAEVKKLVSMRIKFFQALNLLKGTLFIEAILKRISIAK